MCAVHLHNPVLIMAQEGWKKELPHQSQKSKNYEFYKIHLTVLLQTKVTIGHTHTNKHN
jgi:hypothetical protein